MKIFGQKGRSGLYLLPAVILSPSLEKAAQIRFIVDTGASITSLGMFDAVRNNIDVLKLKKSDNGAVGIGGHIETFDLTKCSILFLNSDNKYHKEKLDIISVFYEPNVYNREYKPLPSLLGIDILTNFTILFSQDKNYIILEK